MNNFPDSIDIRENKKKLGFDDIFYDLYLSYLRTDIFKYMIKHHKDENNYFDIDLWCRNNIGGDTILVNKMISKIISELEKKGWNCKLSFGETALFIFSTEKPPSLCFDDNF